MDEISCDRRVSSRYSLQLRLRYHVLEGLRSLWTGTGTTSDMSRTGMRFDAARPVPLGARVEMEVEWPVRLGGTLPLELCLTGSVVRSDAAGVAVCLTSWRFRVAPAPKRRIAERDRTRRWIPPARPHPDEEQPHLM
jgi:hypothetical protein